MKKKIVLSYTGCLSEILAIDLLKLNNFEIIILIINLEYIKNDIKNFFLKKKIKIIYIKNFKKEFFNNYINEFIKSSVDIHDDLIKILYNSLIFSELIKFVRKYNTKYIYFNVNNKKMNDIYHKFYENELILINPFKILKIKSKITILNFYKKNNIKIKYKNDKNKINTFQTSIYPIYLVFTFKNGKIVKLNNCYCFLENLISKLNKLSLLYGLNVLFKKDVNINFIGFEIICFIKNILREKIFSIEINNFIKIISIYYYNSIINNFWWNKERLIIQKLLNFFQKKINGIIKIKIFSNNIKVVKITI